MVTKNHFDLIVVGSGSAGASAWATATRMGKRVAVVERHVLGGECPTFACVPTKALLHCAEVYQTVRNVGMFGIDVSGASFDYGRIKERKDLVVSRTGAAQGEKPYREAGVEVIYGEAKFTGPQEIEVDGQRYHADKFLITTGSDVRVPEIEGLKEAGFLTFKEAIDLTSLPASILILGGGPVGCEFTQLFNAFGVQVTIVDRKLPTSWCERTRRWAISSPCSSSGEECACSWRLRRSPSGWKTAEKSRRSHTTVALKAWPSTRY